MKPIIDIISLTAISGDVPMLGHIPSDLELRPMCHASALRVRFMRVNRVLRLSCSTCGEHVSDVALGPLYGNAMPAAANLRLESILMTRTEEEP